MGRGLLLFLARFLWTLIRWTFIGLWFILPWVFRLLRGAFLLASAGIGGLLVGIPQATQRLADTWSGRIEEWGIPLPTVERLVPLMRVWAFILIFMGWVVIGLVVGVIIIWAT